MLMYRHMFASRVNGSGQPFALVPTWVGVGVMMASDCGEEDVVLASSGVGSENHNNYCKYHYVMD